MGRWPGQRGRSGEHGDTVAGNAVSSAHVVPPSLLRAPGAPHAFGVALGVPGVSVPGAKCSTNAHLEDDALPAECDISEAALVAAVHPGRDPPTPRARRGLTAGAHRQDHLSVPLLEVLECDTCQVGQQHADEFTIRPRP